MASKDANEKLAAFFGKIPRDECTRVLSQSRKNGTYLIRYGAPRFDARACGAPPVPPPELKGWVGGWVGRGFSHALRLL